MNEEEPKRTFIGIEANFLTTYKSTPDGSVTVTVVMGDESVQYTFNDIDSLVEFEFSLKQLLYRRRLLDQETN